MPAGVILDRHSGKPLVDVDPLLRERGLEHVSRLLELAGDSKLVGMAEVNPPLYQDVDLAYSGDELGLPYRDLIREGVVATTDLAVSQRAAGANMSVDVAAGAAWIQGDDNVAAQPTYRVRSDSVVNLAIAAADATNPRIDRVIAEVLDATFSGTQRLWRLRVITGTPTAGATLANLTGAAAIPNNALLLANALIPATATTVTNANIDTAGNKRNPVALKMRQWFSRAQLTASTSVVANAGGYTQLPLSVANDPFGAIGVVTNSISTVDAATYLIIGHVQWAVNTLGGSRRAGLFLSGSLIEEEVDPGLTAAATSPAQGQTVATITALAAFQNVQLWAYNENAGGTAISVTGASLSVVRIGA